MHRIHRSLPFPWPLLLAMFLLMAGCDSSPPPEPTAAPTPTGSPAPPITSTPSPTFAPTPTPDPEVVLRELAAITVDIRGLEPKTDVTQTFLSDEEMRDRMRERLEEDLAPVELEAEQRVLAMLDLVRADLDLKQLLMDLYSGQVVGYYDTEDKELVVRQYADGIGILERVTYVHEFTHALQDQHFDLHGRLERLREEDNSDRRMAFRALVEGDALLTERHYMLGHLTEDERFLLLFGAGGDRIPEETPDYILRTLFFPYRQGADFVSSLHRLGGWDEVNRAYDNPPLSSSHILHVEKYLEGEDPFEVDLLRVEDALADDWDLRLTNVLGEFSLSLHLGVFLETDLAEEASEGWRGDRYAYMEDDADQGLLVLLTKWDSTADASFFFQTYLELVDLKSGGDWLLVQDSPDRRGWETGDDRELFLQRKGDAVLLVWAPDGSVVHQVEKAVWE